MTFQIRAHFDGQVLVPEEPLDLPVNQTLTVRVDLPVPVADDELARLAALERVVGRAVDANLPAAALARETIYEDRL